MKNISTLIALMTLIPLVTVANDKQPDGVKGLLVQLNKPGAISVEISIGSDDGVKAGDVFVVTRKDKRIGKLKVAKAAVDSSTATISDVVDGETLNKGDQVVKQR